MCNSLGGVYKADVLIMYEPPSGDLNICSCCVIFLPESGYLLHHGRPVDLNVTSKVGMPDEAYSCVQDTNDTNKVVYNISN